LIKNDSWICACGYEFPGNEPAISKDTFSDTYSTWPSLKSKIILILGAFIALGIYILAMGGPVSFLTGFWLLPMGLAKAIFQDNEPRISLFISYTFYLVLLSSLFFTKKNVFTCLYIILAITLVLSMHGCQQILKGLSSIT
jgi:hypothetical protein